MPPAKNCPKCNSSSWVPSDNLVWVGALYKEKHGYNATKDTIYPLRMYICSNCNYVEFYRDAGPS